MAKIIGNTTATPNPRPDWEQTDVTKADFILNKPTVDQEYNADSANAQSGTAVAEIIQTINEKIDELTQTHNDDKAALEQADSDMRERVDTAEEDIDGLQEQIKGLSGAMHFIGVSTTDPTSTDGVTIEGEKITTFAQGDVVVYGNKEFVYDGTSFKEFGDATINAQELSNHRNDKSNPHSVTLDQLDDTGVYVKMTSAERTKLDNIAAGAKVNVQPDWNQTDEAQDDFIKNKPNINDAVTYTNTSAPINTVGGISPKTFPNGFANQTFSAIMEAMFYPYTKPVVGALTLNPESGVQKKRTSFTLSTASATITKKSKDIKTIEIYKGSTKIASKNQTISSSATVSINMKESLIAGKTEADLVISDTTTIKIRAIDTDDGYTESSAAYTFVDPYYAAVLNTGDAINEANIAKADNEKIETKGTKTYSYTTTPTQFPVIAYPKSYGALTSIKDANGFSQTWTCSTITINGVEYYVYYGGVAAATDFKYTFTY